MATNRHASCPQSEATQLRFTALSCLFALLCLGSLSRLPFPTLQAVISLCFLIVPTTSLPACLPACRKPSTLSTHTLVLCPVPCAPYSARSCPVPCAPALCRIPRSWSFLITSGLRRKATQRDAPHRTATPLRNVESLRRKHSYLTRVNFCYFLGLF